MIGLVVAAVTLLAVFIPTVATAQETVDPAEEPGWSGNWYSVGREALRWQPGLWTAPEIKVEKDRSARAPGWSTLLTANLAAGWDSNVYESPDDERRAAVLDAGLRAELRRYLTPRDRLRIWGLASAAPVSASSLPDAYSQEAGFELRRRLSPSTVLALAGEVENENDHAVRIDGDDTERDYAHLRWEIAPSVRFRMAGGHSLRIAWMARRLDFREHSGLVSLDHWETGPSALWRSPVGPRGDVEAFYSFRRQAYDDDPAESAAGLTVPGAPTERHHFHRAAVRGYLRPTGRTELVASYELAAKDDRHEGWESWTEHGVRAGASWMPRERWNVSAESAFRRRDYDHRPATGGGLLEYDRVESSLSVGFRRTRALTLYGTASFVTRDTNRDTGGEYRDHDVFRLLGGLSVTY